MTERYIGHLCTTMDGCEYRSPGRWDGYIGRQSYRVANHHSAWAKEHSKLILVVAIRLVTGSRLGLLF